MGSSYSGAPVDVPAVLSSADTAAANRDAAALTTHLDDMFGTIANVTGARNKGVTYTNTSGRPKMCYVKFYMAVGSVTGITVTINGVAIAYNLYYDPTTAYNHTVNFIVPNGATYRVDSDDAYVSWFEQT